MYKRLGLNYKECRENAISQCKYTILIMRKYVKIVKIFCTKLKSGAASRFWAVKYIAHSHNVLKKIICKCKKKKLNVTAKREKHFGVNYVY